MAAGLPRVIGNYALGAMFHAALHNKDLVELDDLITATREMA